MARAQTAFLERKDVPARQALQKAVDALKLKLTLDDGYVPFKSSGYLPCTLDGEDAGFDIRFHDAAELATTPELQSQIAGNDAAIAFRWGGDPREYASVMIVCAALAKDFGAIVHVPDDNSVYATQQLID